MNKTKAILVHPKATLADKAVAIAYGVAQNTLAATGALAAYAGISVATTAVLTSGSTVANAAADTTSRAVATTQNFTRALTQKDLGVQGTLAELRGSFSVIGEKATVRIDMIRGDVRNPFQILDNLMATARGAGASTLRIEATLANERLFDILSKRYGLVSEGTQDFIEVSLK